MLRIRIYSPNSPAFYNGHYSQSQEFWRHPPQTSCFGFILVDSQTIMAASQNVPELGGYDYEFTGNVPDNYECLVCFLPMRDPVQIVGCGHRLCSICMESLLR